MKRRGTGEALVVVPGWKSESDVSFPCRGTHSMGILVVEMTLVLVDLRPGLTTRGGLGEATLILLPLQYSWLAGWSPTITPQLAQGRSKSASLNLCAPSHSNPYILNLGLQLN